MKAAEKAHGRTGGREKGGCFGDGLNLDYSPEQTRRISVSGLQAEPSLKCQGPRRQAVSPAHSLLKFVEKTAADLVIIGSHGHGVIASPLLGSVAEGMVRKAAVPTLVVPALKE